MGIQKTALKPFDRWSTFLCAFFFPQRSFSIFLQSRLFCVRSVLGAQCARWGEMLSSCARLLLVLRTILRSCPIHYLTNCTADWPHPTNCTVGLKSEVKMDSWGKGEESLLFPFYHLDQEYCCPFFSGEGPISPSGLLPPPNSFWRRTSGTSQSNAPRRHSVKKRNRSRLWGPGLLSGSGAWSVLGSWLDTG